MQTKKCLLTTHLVLTELESQALSSKAELIKTAVVGFLQVQYNKTKRV